MKNLKTLSGESVSNLGMGTWCMGETNNEFNNEIEVLKFGIENNLNLIDTAEMYANGGSEKLISNILKKDRDKIFVVTKIYPHNASGFDKILSTCSDSLRRLKTDYIDLYLLHWRGNSNLNTVLSSFLELKFKKKIRYFGVSNFDLSDMKEIYNLNKGSEVSFNQILYNLSKRGAEYGLIPWHNSNNIFTMAYSPLNQKALMHSKKLLQLSKKYGVSPSQFALKWLLNHKNMLVIPKTSSLSHLKENIKAKNFTITSEMINDINNFFPPPKRKNKLDII